MTWDFGGDVLVEAVGIINESKTKMTLCVSEIINGQVDGSGLVAITRDLFIKRRQKGNGEKSA